MKEVRQLHQQAMNIAEKAFDLKKQERYSDNYKVINEVQKLFKEAFLLEKKAALLVPVAQKNEPSRSILFRSAASLALNADLLDEAEKMIAHGIVGFPPEEIAMELRELFLTVYKKRDEQLIAA